MNALPATFTADMWAHQYNQQAEPGALHAWRSALGSNGPESNLFGMEPNFGCCTANIHQGWPKLVRACGWRRATAASRPCLRAQRGAHRRRRRAGVDRRGNRVPVPRHGDVHGHSRSARPVPPDIPGAGWAAGTTIALNGQRPVTAPPGDATFEQVTWKPGDRVVFKFPMRTRLGSWDRDAVTVERGPFVYALRIEEEWKEVPGGMKHPAVAPAKDWEGGRDRRGTTGCSCRRTPLARSRCRKSRLANTPSARSARRSRCRPRAPRAGMDARRGVRRPDPKSPVVSKEKTETVDSRAVRCGEVEGDGVSGGGEQVGTR